MIDLLEIIWIGFLITWFFLLVIRMRLNYVIRKKQRALSHYPGKQVNAVEGFFLYAFTLYNKPYKFEEPGFRRLKTWTNVLHQLFIYGFIIMIIFSIVALIIYDINEHERQRNAWRNHRNQTNCINDLQPRFGHPYNEIRKEKNLIPLPADFCMSTSDEKNEIWEPQTSSNQTYFHQIKYVYIENGKWKGEYDIFVHREYKQPDETLTAEFNDLDGTMDVLYLYNDMGISERKFIEMMGQWGLENELWDHHSIKNY